MEVYDGADWTEMDIEDLRAAIDGGASIEEAAEFLRRGVKRDCSKADGRRKELGQLAWAIEYLTIYLPSKRKVS